MNRVTKEVVTERNSVDEKNESLEKLTKIVKGKKAEIWENDQEKEDSIA